MCRGSGYSWSREWPGRRVVPALPAQAPRRRGSRGREREWGRRTGRFRRPHAGGGGGSSNGRPAGQPDQQEPPPGPAPGCGAVTAERLGAAEGTVKKAAGARDRRGLAMTGSPLPGVATGSEKGYAALAPGRGGTGRRSLIEPRAASLARAAVALRQAIAGRPRLPLAEISQSRSRKVS
jgi:hypothetical protein